MTQIPINIRIRFGKETVKLKTAQDVGRTVSGVKLFLKTLAGGIYQAIAEIPDGTLGVYMHNRPEIVAIDWEVVE